MRSITVDTGLFDGCRATVNCVFIAFGQEYPDTDGLRTLYGKAMDLAAYAICEQLVLVTATASLDRLTQLASIKLFQH
jgi:hypothetical protein